MPQFKFNLSEEVYSNAYRQNGTIIYRQYVETIDSSFNEYGVIFQEGESRVIRDVKEALLNSGRRDDW